MAGLPFMEKNELEIQSPTHAELIEHARRYGPACIEALAHEMQNGSGASRISAAKELLDRGFGKIGQPVEVGGSGGGPVEARVELSPEVAAMLGTVAGFTQ